MSVNGFRMNANYRNTEIISVSSTFPHQFLFEKLLDDLGIDGSLLMHINEEDLLNDLNIQIRLHRVKLFNEIKKLTNINSAILQPANAPSETLVVVEEQKSNSLGRAPAAAASSASNVFQQESHSPSSHIHPHPAARTTE